MSWLYYIVRVCVLLPGLGPRWGWSTPRSPPGCSCPGIGSSGKWLPAPAAAGWWSESFAVFASFSWTHPHFHRHFSARQTSPFLGRIILRWYLVLSRTYFCQRFGRSRTQNGSRTKGNHVMIGMHTARQSTNMQTCLIKVCVERDLFAQSTATLRSYRPISPMF